MALIKEIPTKFGIPASYWKVARINIDYHARRSYVLVYGWPNAEARQAGAAPIVQTPYQWSGDAFPFDIPALDAEGVNAVKLAYEKLKTMPEFTEAQDA